MVSLAGGEPLTRDQQGYVILLQDKIAERWQPVPEKIKYNVGLEFTLNRAGLVTDEIKAVSSMSPRKTIESCRDAIRRADRFGALPAQFKTEPQTFLCEFLYNPQDPVGAAHPSDPVSPAAPAAPAAASSTGTSTVTERGK